jgi:hypothetical protein
MSRAPREARTRFEQRHQLDDALKSHPDSSPSPPTAKSGEVWRTEWEIFGSPPHASSPEGPAIVLEPKHENRPCPDLNCINKDSLTKFN